jgi:putative DNA primase/helicase
MIAGPEGTTSLLLPHHAEYLRVRAVDDKIVRERGYASALKKTDLLARGFGRSQQLAPAMVLPVWSVRREIESYQLRPDSPRLDERGKPRKFEFKWGSNMLLDFLPRWTTPNDNGVAPIADPSIRLLFTEGIPKGDAASSVGICTGALLGVWNWRGRNSAGGKVLLADFEWVALEDRDVYVAFDSDVMEKPGVYKALVRFAAILEARHAKVKFIYLPIGPNGEKTGIDDHVAREQAAGRTPAEICDGLFAMATAELRKPPCTNDREMVGDKDVVSIAKMFVRERATLNSVRTLQSWNDSFWRWTGSYYRKLNDSELASEITAFLQDEVFLVKSTKDGPVEVEPNTWHTTNTLTELKGLIHLGGADVSPPEWLDDAEHDDARMIPVRNGLLTLSTRKLDDANPTFFNLYAIDTDYDENATCPNWLAFLAQMWANDQQSIDCLQEVFGYLVESKNEQQKAFLIVTPPRGGKGTIARVLEHLKRGNVAKPTLKDFTQPYGLEHLIGKSLAIIADARMDARNDDATFAVERILSITGGDKPAIPRKFKTHYEPGLDTVFVILANELPMLPDTSGALPNRFIPLRTFVSFLGREDPMLFQEKLKPELSGILNWALDGLERLEERGHFVLPDTSADLLEEFAALSNPLARFYADRVTLIPVAQWPEKFESYVQGYLVDKTVLYNEYVHWCKANERHPKHYDHFFRDVGATGVDTNFRWDPVTHTSRTHDGKKAQRWVRGLQVREAMVPPREDAGADLGGEIASVWCKENK